MLAVFTLTRDRKIYTERMFEQLKDCGYTFDHFVLDNGSRDGTPAYLKKLGLKGLYLSTENLGLWQGINRILKETNHFEGYDLVLKLDNDLEFPDKNWLDDLVFVYENNAFDILTPFVEGICEGRGGAARFDYVNNIGLVTHCGGAALLTKQKFYAGTMPNGTMAMGWDTWFCRDKKCGIVEDIHVKHDTLAQERDMPDYYKRKVEESKKVYE